MNDIDIRTDRGVVVAAPIGDIDMSNAHAVRAAILAALPNERESLVVDLSGTRYVDSAGVRLLFSIARRLTERRRRLAIVAPADTHVRRVLSIVDMESHATLHETLDAARDAVEPAPG